MAVDTWPFSIQLQDAPTASFDYRVRTVQFGDNYEQIADDGINPETITFPISFIQHNRVALPVLAWLRAHRTKAFIFTPPNGIKGLYRVVPDSIAALPISKNVSRISATLKEVYGV